ncbi:MAK10-like protein [Tanacetum coccineum]
MEDENPIRTLGDYSKPSHEGYKNTTELPVGNNVLPLRSDPIRLVQNGCSFHGLRFEDPNQHLKDFLKLVDSLNLDGSITTWEDLTTRFLAQFFPPGRTAKLYNDILMFQKYHGESLSEAWTRFKDLLQKVPHHGIDFWLQNDPRDFAKPVKTIALPQDVPSTSDRHLIELENQVQCLIEAHLTLTQPTQVNKITTLCEICSVPHDTQYCMEDPEQAFVEYAFSCTDEAGGEIPAKMEDPELFTLPYRLGDSEPFDTLADLGSCVNIIPLYLFKKLNIELLEETGHIFRLVDRTKSYPVGIVKDVEVRIGKLKLLNDFYVIDMKKDPKTPLLVGRGFLATANAVIDCRMAKIVVGEGITRSVFDVKGVNLGEEEAPYWTTLRKRESYKL